VLGPLAWLRLQRPIKVSKLDQFDSWVSIYLGVWGFWDKGAGSFWVHVVSQVTAGQASSTSTEKISDIWAICWGGRGVEREREQN